MRATLCVFFELLLIRCLPSPAGNVFGIVLIVHPFFFFFLAEPLYKLLSELLHNSSSSSSENVEPEEENAQ